MTTHSEASRLTLVADGRPAPRVPAVSPVRRFRIARLRLDARVGRSAGPTHDKRDC